MTRSSIALTGYVALLCVLLAACDSLLGGSSSSAQQNADLDRLTIVPTAPKTTPNSPAPTQTTTPSSIGPIATPELVATLTPVLADGQCPAITSPALPDKPAMFGAVLSTITDYLNAGADAKSIATALKAWGYVATLSVTQQQVGEARTAVVLPNSGEQLVVSFVDPNVPPSEDGGVPSYPGDVGVLVCAGGRYVLAYDALRDPAFPDGVVPNPRLVNEEDVTGDGVGDLSFTTGECTGDACYDGLTIVSAHGGEGHLHAISGQIEPILSPSWQFVSPAGSDAGPATGKTLLAVQGTTADVEAGPQRPVTDTWVFDGGVFTRTGSVMGPALYRIHALHDADEALRRKDFTAADARYQQVIFDPNLKSWETMSVLKDEDRVLAAFAQMRLLQTSIMRGDSVGMLTAYESLVSAVPEGGPGDVYLQMGKIFFDIYSQTDDYGRACAAAIAFAQKEPDSYGQLGPETFGYSNADYTADDMCLMP